MPRLKRALLTTKFNIHASFFRIAAERRGLMLSAGPVLEVHDAYVYYDPVGNLVLGRVNRPVIGEQKVLKVIVPNSVMKIQRIKLGFPRIARTWVILQHWRRNRETFQSGGKRDASLAGIDDDVERLTENDRERDFREVCARPMGHDCERHHTSCCRFGVSDQCVRHVQ